MEELNRESVGRWAGQRALSTPTAAIVMIVVILVVGGLGYVGLNAQSSSPVNKSSCSPSASPACQQGSAAHDVGLQVPFKAVQQGSVVPYTATLPNGEIATSYTFDFGDNNTATGTSSSAQWTYQYPGTYIASVTAVVNGAVHDNYFKLVPIAVAASYGSASAGNIPGVVGTVVTNSSPVAGVPPSAILQAGDSLTVQGTYSSAPTNPLFALQAPTWAASPGLTPSNPTSTGTSATATYTFPASGSYWVTFVGSAKDAAAGTVAIQDYTWSVFVAPGGIHAGAIGGGAAVSPHKNSLNIYELVPGGSSSEDPAIDYETAGYEPILNVYQTLISYNGSQVGPTYTTAVPVLATCVPGSDVGANNCQSIYGSTTLINGYNYTFVIDPNAQFYDPATGASWGVYPTDVYFSAARTMAFSTDPCVGCNNGWILTQALLPDGNGAWSGLHFPYNNTPENIANSMTINGTDCPAVALTASHGCITFHANGGGKAWPYFLELVADPLGMSVVPCGWFSAPAQGAGIPYWTAGNVSGSGDHPCGAPGSPGYGVDLTTVPPLAWDTYEDQGGNPPFIGNVQWNMAGSGPYYLQNMEPGISYALTANPAYASNPMCTWKGCWPQPNEYAKDVSVLWETSQIPGEQAYAAGTADFASIPSTDTSFLLQLIQQGKLVATSAPSISIYFFPFNLAFDMAGAQQYTSNAITVPTDWFSHVGIRQFFTHAYPYQTIQQTISTKSGIQFLFNYGGAIPKFLADYYPTNVSFPSTDPVSDAATVGGAAWWWAQTIDPTSQYYSSDAAACSTAVPCQLPLFGQTGAPDLDQRMSLWAGQISSLTNGAVKVTPLDINFIDLVINSLYLGPYLNPMPFYTLGWAPDYPDPTDYVIPLYLADGSYTWGSATLEQTTLAAFNDPSCVTGTGQPSANYGYWSNLAETSGIPDNCQGAAFLALQDAMAAAGVMDAGPQRVLTYAMAEQIANALALYTYWGQANTIIGMSSWIDPTTPNVNITIGGGGDQTWFTINGNGVW